MKAGRTKHILSMPRLINIALPYSWDFYNLHVKPFSTPTSSPKEHSFLPIGLEDTGYVYHCGFLCSPSPFPDLMSLNAKSSDYPVVNDQMLADGARKYYIYFN